MAAQATPDIAALIQATAAPLGQRRVCSLFCPACGRSSVVEHQLPKLSVVGSIPIARSNKIKGLAESLSPFSCRTCCKTFRLRFNGLQWLAAIPRDMSATTGEAGGCASGHTKTAATT
jgi:hypothetical protein